MLTSLSAKNKVEYVDGTAFQLAKTDSTFSAWNQCDSMVVSWLSRCFHLYSSKYHLDGQTPQKNWNDLRTRYALVDLSCISDLQMETSSLNQGEFPLPSISPN